MVLRDLRFLLFGLAFTTPLALAQNTPQPAPLPTCASPALATFDVATVKPSQTGGPGDTSINNTADGITINATAFHIIESAYDLHDFQIVDVPDWVKTTAWDVAAKVDQPSADYFNLRTADREVTRRQRTQAVLAQRFDFKCHFETPELPVYNLVLAKGGSRLKPTAADASRKGEVHSHGSGHEHRVEYDGVELSALIEGLSSTVGRTVIDKTGLTGLYDFTLTYTSDPDAGSPASTSASEPSGPTIFTALEEQLGLKLESAKGPVPVLIIDSIDKPSEN